ncbi:MAG: hypothetical protein CMC13_15595 [Flavobacteriaceae bacterium]|nr:hypothetical protein [Flavobacteriaceae bacterium]
MDAIQITILSCTLALCIGGWLLSLSRSRKLKGKHSERMENLAQSLAIHQSQITKRHNSLQRYDFLQYNINEALQPQPEIDVPQ